MKRFSALLIIGLADGLIHWQVFFVLCTALGLTQATSNFFAYCVAAGFSLYVNTLYKFEAANSVFAYLLFSVSMGGLSYAIGALADARDWQGLLTVALFTLLNLALGYGFFRCVVCRGERQ
ncbi:polysaccharide synthesis protein GtrA [Pseudomonas sp. efr-133-TYG-5]|uniref:polysaccharide synthesis protein GtrA n=1 Tax=Pseudomonas sp. efr-133-TYG-5 TaxID=3040310 RepID=UPI00255629B0|nr:polysaccharide synthesis protein GtrA [Pseudomonas sp. efr-133-TYG-5]